MISAATWSAVKTSGKMEKVSEIGTWMTLAVGCCPQIMGMKSAPAASSWDRPIVATVRISRGELKNLRMMTSSTRPPRATEASSPTVAARK